MSFEEEYGAARAMKPRPQAFGQREALRVRFAEAALTGLLAGKEQFASTGQLARRCFDLADQMLEELENRR